MHVTLPKNFNAKEKHNWILCGSPNMFSENSQHSRNHLKDFITERFTVIITIHNITEGNTFLFINWVIDQKLFMSFSQIALFFVFVSNITTFHSTSTNAWYFYDYDLWKWFFIYIALFVGWMVERVDVIFTSIKRY